MNAIISNGDYTASVQLPVERKQLAGALSYLGKNHASAYDIKYNEESDQGLSFTLDCRGVVENAIAKAIPTGFRFHTFNDTIALMHSLPYQSRREFENTVKVEGLASYEQLDKIKETYKHIPYEPDKWRTDEKSRPKEQGIVVGCETIGKNTVGLVDTGDVHCMMIGAAGVGKTAYWLYPNIEYACASGMSFLSTDTKGDIMRNYGSIASKYYGYHISVIDLRNPMRSHGNNLLHLVNKYIDLFTEHPEMIAYKAKAEKYAKIIAKTIILSGMDAGSFGQNAYFYDAAEGVLTASILLVAEFCKPEERHIVSVFKIIQELLAPSNNKQQKNQFHSLMALLPDDHKAKWFAGAALNTSEQSMSSVMSTALSRLNAFLDSELETILCNDTEIDAEKFCSEKSAIFIIMPEEDSSKYFMVSLIIQQLYREILAVADENGGKLKNRVVFYCDEFGTLPKIESAEMMFSASRSRRVSVVPIIQSLAQLEKNYGKEGAEIIVDNTQLTVFGGFAPNSETAQVLSKSLGTRTVMSGSVSQSKNDPSRSLQMIERPLMTADELKSLPKGTFVVTKTGFNPIKVKLKLFFKWGIQFEVEPYVVPLRDNKDIHYASKDTLMRSVYEKYSPDKKGEEEIPPGSYSVEQILGEKNYPESEKNARHGGRAVLHSSPPENGA